MRRSGFVLSRFETGSFRLGGGAAFGFRFGAGFGGLSLSGFLSGLGARLGGGAAFGLDLGGGFLGCFAARGFFSGNPGGLGLGGRSRRWRMRCERLGGRCGRRRGNRFETGNRDHGWRRWS